MKFKEIQTGKTYYRTLREKDKRSTKTNYTISRIFVIQKDLRNEFVLASINGTPAELFEKNQYSRWKADKPTY